MVHQEYQNLVENGLYEEAIVYLDKHASSFIDLSYIYDQKGRLYHLLGNLEEAIVYLENAYTIDQDQATLLELGTCYLEAEEYSKAEEVFLILQDPYNLSLVKMETKNYLQAIEILENLEEDSWVNMNLMICYEMTGDLEKAREYALKEADKDLDALNELIVLNNQLKIYDDQEKLIDILEKEDPDLGRLQRGLYYIALKQSNQAIIELEKVENYREEALEQLLILYVSKSMKEKAYLTAKEFYLLKGTQEALETLIEVGLLKKEAEAGIYLEKYLNQYGKNTFYSIKELQYLFYADFNQGITKLEKNSLQDQEEYQWILFQYLEKQKKKRIEPMRNILKLRGFTGEYPTIELEGVNLLEKGLERVYEFSDGLAYMEDKDGGAYIDLKGNRVTHYPISKDTTNRQDTYLFHFGIAIGKKEDGYYAMNQDGIIVEGCQEMAFTKTGYYYVKDHKSIFKEALRRVYPYYCRKVHEGKLAYRDGDQCGYLLENGEILIPAQYENAYDFHDGLAKVVKDGKTGFINEKNEMIISASYDWADRLYGNLIAVKKEKCGVINTSSEVMMPLEYDEIKADEKYYYVCRNGKWGVFDHHFQIIVELIYDEILYFWQGISRVKLGNYYGGINEQGEVVIPILFDHMTYAKKGMVIVGVQSRFGYMSTKGKLLSQIIYSTATLKGYHDYLCVSVLEDFYIIEGENLWKD